ncbi:MAG: HNH endonuclease [Planctomycetaceae bacterium]|nr:HNH endonuclease [Planctomycetaceae bacterium]
METQLKELVWSRANGCCEYCEIPQVFDPIGFQIDHIIADQHRGSTSQENLALACYTCNHHKGPNIAGFDLETNDTVPLFNPRKDVWSDHFRWNGAELQGLTPVGRVTVHVLAINRDFRVALRRTLIQERVFPPHRP